MYVACTCALVAETVQMLCTCCAHDCVELCIVQNSIIIGPKYGYRENVLKNLKYSDVDISIPDTVTFCYFVSRYISEFVGENETPLVMFCITKLVSLTLLLNYYIIVIIKVIAVLLILLFLGRIHYLLHRRRSLIRLAFSVYLMSVYFC